MVEEVHSNRRASNSVAAVLRGLPEHLQAAPDGRGGNASSFVDYRRRRRRRRGPTKNSCFEETDYRSCPDRTAAQANVEDAILDTGEQFCCL